MCRWCERKCSEMMQSQIALFCHGSFRCRQIPQWRRTHTLQHTRTVTKNVSFCFSDSLTRPLFCPSLCLSVSLSVSHVHTPHNPCNRTCTGGKETAKHTRTHTHTHTAKPEPHPIDRRMFNQPSKGKLPKAKTLLRPNHAREKFLHCKTTDTIGNA